MSLLQSILESDLSSVENRIDSIKALKRTTWIKSEMSWIKSKKYLNQVGEAFEANSENEENQVGLYLNQVTTPICHSNPKDFPQ